MGLNIVEKKKKGSESQGGWTLIALSHKCWVLVYTYDSKLFFFLKKKLMDLILSFVSNNLLARPFLLYASMAASFVRRNPILVYCGPGRDLWCWGGQF